MSQNPIAKTIAEIAARERALAVEEGDYTLAFLCAIVEHHAREVLSGRRG